ncbi:MAG TPA: hypothetical protein VNB29_01340, partial [Chthoniobacterales bacterium]|nr:hypothetical protein [Chthoniobacterales bacterium]
LVVLIVVGAHLLVGLGAAVWVVAQYFDKPKAKFTAKPVDIKPEPPKHMLPTQDTSSRRPSASMAKQIQSLMPSTLAMPPMPEVPVDVSVPVDSAPTADLGAGTPQVGGGTGTGSGFFGSAGKPGSGLLEGTLYDLKQLKNGSPSGMDRNKYMSELARIADRGPQRSLFSRYYEAPTKLYLPHLAIPQIKADDAPKEFHVEDKVQPRMWVALYEGKIVAPETGKFMLYGMGDDILLVWLNRRLLIDGSYYPVSPLGGPKVIPAQRKTPDFTMQKGSVYTLQILIGENPGGGFYAWLQAKNLDTGKVFWVRMTGEPVQWDRSKPMNRPDATPLDAENGPIWAPAMEGKSASNLSGMGM